jgi:hypothetical protein
VKLVKIYSIVSGTGGGEIAFWMYGKVRMISLIGEKG